MRLGHRRFAFVSHHMREHAGERRRLGFEKALKRRRPDAGRHRRTAPRPSSRTTTCRRSPRSTIWSAAAYACPDDVSVVGYDDVPMAAHCRMQLTTVRSDAMEMSRRAVELVVAASRDGRHVSHREILANPLRDPLDHGKAAAVSAPSASRA